MDEPRDPVVWLLWRLWRVLGPASPVPSSLEILMPIVLAVDTTATAELKAKRADGSYTALPRPIAWESTNPEVVAVIPGGIYNETATLLAKSPGEASIVASAGPLRITQAVTVAPDAVELEIVINPQNPA